MLSTPDDFHEKRSSVRDHLVGKFQFIHFRLAKIYNAFNGKVDVQVLWAAAQTFIEELPLPVFFVNLEGRFLYGNKKAEELIGYSRNETVGKTYYEVNLVSLNELMKIASLFALHALDRAFGPYRMTVRRKDGSRIRVELLTRLIDFSSSKIIMSTVRQVDESRSRQEETDEEVERRLDELNRGMSPVTICSDCKKVQASQDEWTSVESFLYTVLGLEFSHGYCPACLEKRKREL